MDLTGIAARHPGLRRVAWIVLAVVVGVAGAWLALRVAGAERVTAGPFDVRLAANLGPGATTIDLSPLGTLTAVTHHSPIRLTATLQDVRVPVLQQDLKEQGLDRLVSTVETDAIRAVKRYAIRAFVIAIAGAALLALLVFRRRWRLVAIAVLSALLAVGGSAAVAFVTYRPDAFTAPTYSGSLALAPELVGPLTQAGAQIDAFRAELTQVVDGATRAYATIDQNPLGRSNEIRILHISDLHLSPLGEDFALQLAKGFDVNAVIDTGDITSFGTPLENPVLSAIAQFGRPYIYVRGNHDSRQTQAAIAAIPNATVLDGSTTTVAGLTVYGLGDPSYTASRVGPTDEKAFAAAAQSAGQRVLRDVQALPRPPDIVAVHDDRMAASVAGLVPLVISGHFHQQSATAVDGTLYLRIGSTGGAGFDTFLPKEGQPLSAEILHFRPATGGGPPKLIAYDVITQFPTTGNLTVVRHLVSKEFGTLTPSPVPSPTKSPPTSPSNSPS